MSKYINEDAEKLIDYFKKYELKDIFSKEEFLGEYKKVHKKALGYLVIVSEIERQNIKQEKFTGKSIFYLKESVSDVLQSLFAWVNGAYKAADLLLRSSIENFNKSIIGNSDISIYKEKRVYKIFDKAKQLEEFKVKIGEELFVIVLDRIYSELCKSTHTATEDNMEHITALNLLPQFNKGKMISFRKNFEILVDAYLGFFLGNYRSIVESMHRGNVDIFYEVLPKNIIRGIINC